jgi:RNA polymerase sigma factor (TIGR02999 family)
VICESNLGIGFVFSKIGYMDAEQPSAVELTRILRAWSGGEESALERLAPVVYAELHRIAARNMAGERAGHLLQPSALVNEAYLRLVAGERVEWNSRTHFFAYSARLMRQILVDFARAQGAERRGGARRQADLSGIQDKGAAARPVDFLDLDRALAELTEMDRRQQQVVELRYFGGLDVPEVAAVLGVSEATVVRDWRIARAWLFDRLWPENSTK